MKGTGVVGIPDVFVVCGVFAGLCGSLRAFGIFVGRWQSLEAFERWDRVGITSHTV